MRDRFHAAATILILVGFAMLCQPVSATLFSIGFPVLIGGVLIHVVADHMPRAAAEQGVSEKGR